MPLDFLSPERERSVSIGQLWSLLDMLRFYAEDFVSAFSTYTNAKNTILATVVVVGEGSIPAETTIPPVVRSGARNSIQQLYDIMSKHALLFVRASCGRALHVLQTDPALTNKTLLFLLDDIYVRLQDELRGRVFLCIDPTKTQHFEPSEPLFGPSVQDSFPSSSYDVAEAGKCYALERSTACVMHAMRALETPLKMMATDLGVNSDRDNWGELLRRVDDAVIALSATSDGVRKTLYSECAIQFRFIKDAWRNHSMHAREKYTEEEAQIVLIAAKALMVKLAERLMEPTP